jgi:hypothetical protein
MRNLQLCVNRVFPQLFVLCLKEIHLAARPVFYTCNKVFMKAYLAAPAGKVYRIDGEPQAAVHLRPHIFKFPINGKTLSEGDAEMRGTRGKVELKKVIRRKPKIKAIMEKGSKDTGIVVDSTEQNSLYQYGDSSFHNSTKGSTGSRAKLSRMVDMGCYLQGFVLREERNGFGTKPCGAGNRYTAAKTDEYVRPGFTEPGKKFFKSVVLRSERVPA